jgi:hypothetical protein
MKVPQPDAATDAIRPIHFLALSLEAMGMP